MTDCKSCSNPRTQTWIVVILHLLLTPISAAFFIILLTFSEHEKREIFEDYDEFRTTYLTRIWIGAIYSILTFASAIAVIVAIKTNRYKLLEPFKLLINLGGIFWILMAAFHIYFGVRGDKSFVDIALPVLAYLIVAAFQWLCYIPLRNLRRLMKYEPYISNTEQMAALRYNS